MSGFGDRYIITMLDRTLEVDLTDRTLGFSTSRTVGIGEFGTTSCNITFDNNDGFFTPEEGGGTGIYKNIDWRSKQVKITVFTFPGSQPVRLFNGIVSEIAIEDDGVNSYVTVAAVDWLQAATSIPGEVDALSSAVSVQTAFDNALDGINGWGNGITMPKFGDESSTNSFTVANWGVGTSYTVEPFFSDGMTAHDVISQMLLPVGPHLHFDGYIEFTANFNTYTTFIIDQTLVSYLHNDNWGTFLFSDTPMAGFPIPFRNLVVGYVDDMLTTSATVSSGNFSPAFTSTNAEAESRYGSRPRTYSDTAHAVEEEMEATAKFWSERASNVRYAPISLETTDLMMQSMPAGLDKFWDLCNPLYVSFARALVRYTPTGGSQITVPVVIKARHINATPQETVIRLEFLPAVDWYSFKLDDAYLGVLGGVIDEYDETTFTYDEFSELYDGLLIRGNRLG